MSDAILRTAIYHGISTAMLLRNESAPHLVIIPGMLRWMGDLGKLFLICEKENLGLLDLRGHGQSAHVAGNYSIDALAKDLVAPLACMLGEKPLYIIGESVAGLVALKLAGMIPNPVKRLVLVDPPFHASEATPTHQAMIKMYQGRNEPALKERLRDTARDIFGFDIITGKLIQTKRYHELLSPDLAPRATIITGSLKYNSAEPMAAKAEEPAPAYFTKKDIMRFQELGITRLLVHTFHGVGHSGIREYPFEIMALVRQHYKE